MARSKRSRASRSALLPCTETLALVRSPESHKASVEHTCAERQDSLRVCSLTALGTVECINGRLASPIAQPMAALRRPAAPCRPCSHSIRAYAHSAYARTTFPSPGSMRPLPRPLPLPQPAPATLAIGIALSFCSSAAEAARRPALRAAAAACKSTEAARLPPPSPPARNIATRSAETGSVTASKSAAAPSSPSPDKESSKACSCIDSRSRRPRSASLLPDAAKMRQMLTRS
eukprot:6185780-Pleurochrysis_carterae.AAC.3